MRSSVDRMQEEYAEQVDFHILNVDRVSTRDLAEEFEVAGIPLIVLLDSEGDPVMRLLGYHTEDQLRDALDELLALEAAAQDDAEDEAGNDGESPDGDDAVEEAEDEEAAVEA
ncbi:MAG: hypothetical protein GYB65_23795 [Chloroflexi bacterium]|nr:hypothetical protein [Chloroflexota bacterium]